MLAVRWESPRVRRPPPFQPATIGKMRILVVEDEPRLLRSLARSLREESYAVDTAEAGDDGL